MRRAVFGRVLLLQGDSDSEGRACKRSGGAAPNLRPPAAQQGGADCRSTSDPAPACRRAAAAAAAPGLSRAGA